MLCENDATCAAKAVAMCVLFFASMLFGSLPIYLARIFQWDSDAKDHLYVRLLLSLGGGVLLCTTFLHLLPEVSEKVEKVEKLSRDEIHYAELLLCIGFFAMYFLEECVHAYLHRREKAEAPINLEANHHHSHFVEDTGEDTAVKTIRGLLVVLALSVHELFEGLSVGLESSSHSVWYMFGAVSAHKLVIAFCIGVELVTAGMRTVLVVVYVFTFAVVSPLGIGMGIILSNSEGQASTDLPSILLQGLASGTLLYVVFFEILKTDRKSGLKQFFAVVSGFVIMLGIKMLE